MARSNVSCSMGHTSLYPDKNYVRSEWIHQIARHSDIITISHGALDVLNIVRHKGRITVCDTDHGVIESTFYMRDQYPHLRIAPEFGNVVDVVDNYLKKYGPHNLGAIDLDLTGTVDSIWHIVSKVLDLLKEYRANCLVLVTYRNGRDNRRHGQFSDPRVQWIKERLPTNVTHAWYIPYRSDWIGRYATRERGSSMAIVALRVSHRNMLRLKKAS